MPYIIIPVDKGYKVCKANNPKKCFSNKPLTKKKVEAQLKAIGINENKKGGSLSLVNSLNIIDEIKQLIPNINIVGSVKRKEPINKDIDIITTENLNKILNILIKNIPSIVILKEGQKYLSILYKNIQIDFWKASKNNLKYYIITRTLDKIHNIAFRKRAKELGYKLNNDGLFDKNNKRIEFNDEEELRNILNIKPTNTGMGKNNLNNIIMLSDLTKTDLKRIITTYNIHTKIKDYSKKNKEELIAEINKYCIVDNNVIKIKPFQDIVIPEKVKKQRKTKKPKKEEIKVEIKVEKPKKKMTQKQMQKEFLKKFNEEENKLNLSEEEEDEEDEIVEQMKKYKSKK